MNLSELQASMLRIRLVEESIANKYSEQKMRCPTHLSIGQEAIAVGVCSNLTNEDQVLSSHRAHAHYLAKGGCLNSMLAEIYGKVTGCSKGMGGSMHLIDKSVGFMGSTAIVGNTIPVAVGSALAMKIQEKKSISTQRQWKHHTLSTSFLNTSVLYPYQKKRQSQKAKHILHFTVCKQRCTTSCYTLYALLFRLSTGP